MNREQILQSLRNAQPELARTYSVRSLSLFGSIARGDARPDSDIDILVEFEPQARVTLLTLAGLQSDIQDLLKAKVDLVHRRALRPSFLESVDREAIRVA